MLFYSEEARFDGKWMPQTSTEPPVVKKSSGINRTLYGGRRIRAINKVRECLQHLTLGQLRECYSPDGKFYNKKRGIRHE